MRVVFFIDHLRPDGTQRFLCRLVPALAGRGFAQAVVCLNDSWDDLVLAELRGAGAEVRVVGRAALASGAGLLAVWLWLRARRFDAAVTLLFASDVIGRGLARAAGVPRVVSSLRARNVNYAGWQRAAVRATMRWADGVVLNSEQLRSFALEEEGARAERTLVIPNGVDVRDYAHPVSREDLRAMFGFAPGQPVVGAVGRLTHQKGLDVLLRALALAEPRDAGLLLVGVGEEEGALRALAESLGVAGRVRFAGYRRDVPRLLGALDLYAHPARFEGMPNALLEAMAAGCPVLATDVDGNRELIEGAAHGWLVPPEDEGALAAAIAAALADPAEARRRGEAARRRAAEAFGTEAMAAAWERVLRAGARR